MEFNAEALLGSKPKEAAAVPVPAGGLSDELFEELTREINAFRARIQSGETLSVKEAAKITIWFRARRVKNFELTTKKGAAKKKPAKPRVKKKTAAQTKQDLGDALLDSL